MSDPSNFSPGNSGGGKKIPPANPSTAYGPKTASSAVPPLAQPGKAKPPVLSAPGGIKPPVATPGPAPQAAPEIPSSRPPGTVPPGTAPLRPPPPIPTPQNAKGIGIIIALAIGLPLCLVLACGVGGFLFLWSVKTAATTAANNASERMKQQPVDPNDPFAALNGPQMQKQMGETLHKTAEGAFNHPDAKKEIEKAFDKMAEEMNKQLTAEAAKNNRTRPRPGTSSISRPEFPRPGEEKDDYPTNLKRLQSGNDGDKERAAEWFGRQPLETDKHDEVAKALNNMNTDGLRKHALAALKVWGTKENIPIIAKIMQLEAFVKIDCMDLLVKFKDERAIEPLITMLNEGSREGGRAEEILGDWWPEAEQPLIKHLHDKENCIRERAQRILELKKTDQGLLVAQSLEDFKSPNREVRRSAVDWLAKQNLKADLQPQVAVAAQSLLSDGSNEIRRQATDMVVKYATKDQADELLKLLDEKERDKWLPGLTGLIRLGDVRAAERIGRRKEMRDEAFRLFRQTGKPAEELVQKTFTQIDVKEWMPGKQLCEILGEIGSPKCVGFLQQVKKKATASKTPHVPEAADKAIESIRRRN